VADHCFRSRDYVNLIVIDKQPELQFLDIDAAEEHCARGASAWEWAGSGDGDPQVVLASAGDVPTLEALAAAALLRRHVPDLVFRFVNVVDLMTLPPRGEHPHGLDVDAFADLFTDHVDVVFAFHGYARALHQLLHGRPKPDRFHVRGFSEQGTTTTPFDMVVLNGMSRYDLALEAISRVARPPSGASGLVDHCQTMLARHHTYVREHLEDMREVRDWTWTSP
jgi:xylulose-5-phosphate/fructose-6-phosphate phosphoketolase